MKKVLLFIMLAFSINAFAQHTPALSHPQDPKTNSIQSKKRNHLPQALQFLLNNTSQPGDESSFRSVFGLIQLIDSSYGWGWDTLGAKLRLESKVTDITYNAANLPTNYTFQLWNGAGWDNYLQLVFTYDANNNNTAQIIKLWDGSAWTNYFQTVYTFNSNNDETSELSQFWTGFSWLNLSNYLYTYDANHHLLTEIDQSWTGTAWLNDYKYTYTYSGDDQTVELTQTWNDVDAVWENASQILSTYDGNHNLLTKTLQNWNGLSWDNTSLFTYTYDGNNNQITAVSQFWDGTSWANNSKTTNTYNSNNLLTNSLTQGWNGASYDNASRTTNTYDGTLLTKSLHELWDGNSWKYSNVSFYTYGENDFLQARGNREYDGVDNIITSGDSTYNFFRTVVGTKDLNQVDASLTVYPNPSSGKFTLSSEIGLGSVTIYNSIGERIYYSDKTNDQTQSVNLNGYPHGLYLAIIKEGDYITTRKIIIQ